MLIVCWVVPAGSVHPGGKCSSWAGRKVAGVTVLCPAAFLPGCGVARREVSIPAGSYFGYNGDLFGWIYEQGRSLAIADI